ncbi:hypothetical protein DEE93_17590 [Ralstonia pickettii]|uniref:Uncharacterized protein n=3 Tax=Pseudomonadota TaxID=1224 RepID=A0AAW4Q5S0_RALPI|nr:hypothetical protein [Ralstonia pickettii]MBA9852084.1 hypothetical protein [Ralstonia pickettii]MBA9919901.1 hypothetical protein [Ralstonia pickettii]MBA9959003.1 hypothetical protein [Ralstonia pickettii]MBA9964618.1 hypothetical protein [Ralstonia pickettii]
MSIEKAHAADVQVTGSLLALVQVIRNAAVLYQSETVMAHLLELPKPSDYFVRCKDLFYKTYADQVMKVGLALDDATFTAIVHGRLPAEVVDAKFGDLETNWLFNPGRRENWRKRER